MANICSFILDNGRRCAAPARHDSSYCRHHDPSHSRRRRTPARVAPARNPDAAPTRAEISAYWRATFQRGIFAAASEEALQDHIGCLLQALGDRAICHRSAGRLFAAIEDRRRQLQNEAQQTQLRKMQENLIDSARREGLIPENYPSEALNDLLSAELLRATGPQAQNATR
ncbi:MAG: hypothetical protein WA891_04365 [Acidobacteriaceae bacterium]